MGRGEFPLPVSEEPQGGVGDPGEGPVGPPRGTLRAQREAEGRWEECPPLAPKDHSDGGTGVPEALPVWSPDPGDGTGERAGAAGRSGDDEREPARPEVCTGSLGEYGVDGGTIRAVEVRHREGSKRNHGACSVIRTGHNRSWRQ